MMRPLLIVVALVMPGCTGKGVPEETPPPDEDGTPPVLDEKDATLEPGMLLRILWDPGNSGAGIGEEMEIFEDGAVRYVASVRGSEQVYEKRLQEQPLADLRSMLRSEEFAAVGGSYAAPSHIHDGSHDRMIVATSAGARQIRYYRRDPSALPPSLRRVIAGVEEAHAMFADVNPWNSER